MLRHVSSREISEWQAFEEEHGPAWLRPDHGSAFIVATLANVYRDRKTHPEPYDLTEFLQGGVPDFEQTPEQMAAVAELTAAAMQAAERRA